MENISGSVKNWMEIREGNIIESNEILSEDVYKTFLLRLHSNNQKFIDDLDNFYNKHPRKELYDVIINCKSNHKITTDLLLNFENKNKRFTFVEEN